MPLGRQLEQRYLREVQGLPADTQALLLAAAADPAGDPSLLQEADALGCVEPVSWGYRDLVTLVGELAGLTGPASPQPPKAFTVPPGLGPGTELNVIASIPAGFEGPGTPALTATLTLTTH